jgi:hypothetical protein
MPGHAFAARQLFQHVSGTEAMAGEEHEAVEPQIGDLGDQVDFITVLSMRSSPPASSDAT